MGTAQEGPPILVVRSFIEENDKSKMQYLNHGCLWMASSLWSKYKGWYLQARGEVFPEVEEADESEDEIPDEVKKWREMCDNEEEQRRSLEWVNLYLNPSTFIPPTEDPQDSDDGLDDERKVAIEVPQGKSLGDRDLASMMNHMMQSSARRNGGVGEKITDEFVTSFKSAIKTQAETSNKKKLFILKVQLLNVKEDYIMLQQLVLLDNMELVMVHTVTLIATLVVEGW